MKLTDELIKQFGFVQSDTDPRFFQLDTPKSRYTLRRVEFYDSITKRPEPNGQYGLHNSNGKYDDLYVTTVAELLDAVRSNGNYEGKQQVIGAFRNIMEME